MNWQKKFESGVKLEYFSKFNMVWKLVLTSDRPEELVRHGYLIREVK
jgi:hypothetical protein